MNKWGVWLTNSGINTRETKKMYAASDNQTPTGRPLFVFEIPEETGIIPDGNIRFTSKVHGYISDSIYIDLAKSATKINCIFFSDSTEYKLTQRKANKTDLFLRSTSQKLTTHSVPSRLQNWSPHHSGAWQQVEQALPSTL